MSESPFSPSKHCLEINKTDKSGVFNCPGSSSSSSIVEIFTTTTTNTTTQPGLFIPGRNNIKQSVKKETSLVGGKSLWKITMENH